MENVLNARPAWDRLNHTATMPNSCPSRLGYSLSSPWSEGF